MNPVVCPSCATKNRVPAAADGVPQCAKCKAKLPWLVGASDKDFDAVAASDKVDVLVDLWAPWCGPCLRVAPVLQKLAEELAGTLKVVKVNVDDNPRTQAGSGRSRSRRWCCCVTAARCRARWAPCRCSR